MAVNPKCVGMYEDTTSAPRASAGAASSSAAGTPPAHAWRWHEPVKVVLTTPEKMATHGWFIDTLQFLHRHGKVRRFVIDEAHTMLEWGSSFRPDYLEMRFLRRAFPGAALTAMTATATPSQRDHLANILMLAAGGGTERIVTEFVRPNLYFEASVARSHRTRQCE